MGIQNRGYIRIYNGYTIRSGRTPGFLQEVSIHVRRLILRAMKSNNLIAALSRRLSHHQLSSIFPMALAFDVLLSA